MQGERTAGRHGAIRAVVALAVVAAALLVGVPVARAADPVAPVTKGIACLQGTWSQNLPNSPAGLQGNSTTSAGSVTLQLGPGRRFLQTFASRVVTGQPGPGGTYLQTQEDLTGTVSARYTATLRKLTLTNVENDTTAVQLVAVDDRVSDPATSSPAPGTYHRKRMVLAYTCSGDVLRLQTSGGLAQGYTRTG